MPRSKSLPQQKPPRTSEGVSVLSVRRCHSDRSRSDSEGVAEGSAFSPPGGQRRPRDNRRDLNALPSFTSIPSQLTPALGKHPPRFPVALVAETVFPHRQHDGIKHRPFSTPGAQHNRRRNQVPHILRNHVSGKQINLFQTIVLLLTPMRRESAPVATTLPARCRFHLDTQEVSPMFDSHIVSSTIPPGLQYREQPPRSLRHESQFNPLPALLKAPKPLPRFHLLHSPYLSFRPEPERQR